MRRRSGVKTTRHVDLDRLAADLPEVAEKAMLAGAAVVEGYAKLNIEAQGLVDTGNLKGSPQVYGPERRGRSVIVGVGTIVEYGKYHEFGTSRGLPPRPWLGPAAHDHKAEFAAAAGETARRELDRRTGRSWGP